MASLVNVTALVYLARVFIFYFFARTQKESQPHVHVSAIIYYLIFECSYVYGTSLHQLIQSFWLAGNRQLPSQAARENKQAVYYNFFITFTISKLASENQNNRRWRIYLYFFPGVRKLRSCGAAESILPLSTPPIEYGGMIRIWRAVTVDK